MQKKSLEDFFGKEEKVEEKKIQPTEKIHEDIQSWIEFNREFKAKMAVQPLNLKNVYLLSATYDGEKRCAVLKFYNPADGKIYLWYDNTGHKPYCLTSLPPEELEKISEVMLNEGLDHFEVVEKFNPLLDQNVKVTKIVAHDPLTIGGKPSGSLRDVIPKTRPEAKIWEADIKYYENYLYDRNLEVGVPYNLENGKLIPVRVENKSFLEQIKQVFIGEQKEFLDYILNWVQLLETPVPNLRYVALDIEVESPTVDRVPEPREALYRVICVSFVGSDGLKKVLLLRRDNVEEGDFRLPSDVKLEYCDSEVELFVKVFKLIVDYPIVVTFNGDEFDLRYLWHRAQKLGFPKEEIPIQMGREYAMLTYGIHIDLYRFFFNKAIQTYAFDQKYKEVTLQDISQILLGIGKISLEKNISDLTYLELAAYCLRDSELTFGLTSFDDHLVMKLIVALTRIAKMPMEDVSRQGVSNWIRSLMYKEHRKNGYLIPTSDEILAKKGITSTHAVIKGKKYRGAVVIEPKPGVNFNVVVLDFSSLYPSIIKKWNLSYETVRCPHEECKDNLIPETNHWVCKKKLGLTSLVIGSLRDLRVRWYKVKAKDQSFPSELRRWYSIVQRTLKVILNAAYGVFGAEHFVLYCPPVAEATTSIGRYAIKSTISKAQELGIEVVYGDTDSVFLRSPSEEQIEKLVEWSREVLGMELDVEKFYRYSVFSTRKKNYIGVYLDGNVEIKGLTGKKRNTPEFLKKAFVEMVKILGEVKSEVEFMEAKEKIKKIVKECYTKLKNKEYSLEELAFTVVLGKDIEDYEKTTPQHVKALKRLSEEEREKIGAGSIIRYVKIRREPGVKLLALASLDEIDVEKYVEHIRTTFEQVLDALDISFDEIVGVSKLESFFNN